MPGEIVNLRRVKKAKARDEKEKRAAANRASFGRTKAERQKDAAEQERSARQMEGHRRVPADDDDDTGLP